MGKRSDSTSILSANVERLLREQETTVEAVSRKAGISSRAIHYILKGQRGATLELVDKIARGFGLPSWQLLMPILPATRSASHALDQLVAHYLDAPEPARKYLDMIAEREAQYRRD